MFGKLFIHSLFFQTLFLPGTILATETSLDLDISNERQQELTHLLLHDCGSCHGMTLKGGLGSPLTAEKLKDKPNEALISIILHGIEGKPMPPWKGILDEQEVSWLVDQLKTGELQRN